MEIEVWVQSTNDDDRWHRRFYVGRSLIKAIYEVAKARLNGFKNASMFFQWE